MNAVTPSRSTLIRLFSQCLVTQQNGGDESDESTTSSSLPEEFPATKPNLSAERNTRCDHSTHCTKHCLTLIEGNRSCRQFCCCHYKILDCNNILHCRTCNFEINKNCAECCDVRKTIDRNSKINVCINDGNRLEDNHKSGINNGESLRGNEDLNNGNQDDSKCERCGQSSGHYSLERSPTDRNKSYQENHETRDDTQCGRYDTNNDKYCRKYPTTQHCNPCNNSCSDAIIVQHCNCCNIKNSQTDNNVSSINKDEFSKINTKEFTCCSCRNGHCFSRQNILENINGCNADGVKTKTTYHIINGNNHDNKSSRRPGVKFNKLGRKNKDTQKKCKNFEDFIYYNIDTNKRLKDKEGNNISNRNTEGNNLNCCDFERKTGKCLQETVQADNQTNMAALSYDDVIRGGVYNDKMLSNLVWMNMIDNRVYIPFPNSREKYYRNRNKTRRKCSDRCSKANIPHADISSANQPAQHCVKQPDTDRKRANSTGSHHSLTFSKWAFRLLDYYKTFGLIDRESQEEDLNSPQESPKYYVLEDRGNVLKENQPEREIERNRIEKDFNKIGEYGEDERCNNNKSNNDLKISVDTEDNLINLHTCGYIADNFEKVVILPKLNESDAIRNEQGVNADGQNKNIRSRNNDERTGESKTSKCNQAPQNLSVETLQNKGILRNNDHSNLNISCHAQHTYQNNAFNTFPDADVKCRNNYNTHPGNRERVCSPKFSNSYSCTELTGASRKEQKKVNFSCYETSQNHKNSPHNRNLQDHKNPQYQKNFQENHKSEQKPLHEALHISADKLTCTPSNCNARRVKEHSKSSEIQTNDHSKRHSKNDMEEIMSAEHFRRRHRHRSSLNRQALQKVTDWLNQEQDCRTMPC